MEAADTPGGPDCEKCKFAVETLHTAVTSNDTVSQLLAQADALCDKYAAAFDMARGGGGIYFITAHRATLSLTRVYVHVTPCATLKLDVISHLESNKVMM